MVSVRSIADIDLSERVCFSSGGSSEGKRGLCLDRSVFRHQRHANRVRTYRCSSGPSLNLMLFRELKLAAFQKFTLRRRGWGGTKMQATL